MGLATAPKIGAVLIVGRNQSWGFGEGIANRTLHDRETKPVLHCTKGANGENVNSENRDAASSAMALRRTVSRFISCIPAIDCA